MTTPYTRLAIELSKIDWTYPNSMTTSEQVWILRSTVKSLSARNIVELGTGFGHSTLGLGFGALETNGHVLTIDSHVGSPPAGKTWEDVNNWLLSLGLSVEFMVADDLQVQIPPNFLPIDILFIDTLHYYEQLKAELAKFVPLMSWCGEILVDGVLHKNTHTLGEGKAISEFLQANKQWDYRIYNTEYGLGRLFRRDV